MRNKLAHDGKFSYDDAERALDSMRRLLEAVSAGQTADEISKMREAILRTKFSGLAQKRRTQKFSDIHNCNRNHFWLDAAGVKLLRPHQDVATGEFQRRQNLLPDLAKAHNGSCAI